MGIYINFRHQRSLAVIQTSGGNSVILYESKSIAITNMSSLEKTFFLIHLH